jgi:hypothetical protein
MTGWFQSESTADFSGIRTDRRMRLVWTLNGDILDAEYATVMLLKLMEMSWVAN